MKTCQVGLDEMLALRRVVTEARVLVFDEGRDTIDKRLGAQGLVLEEALDALSALLRQRPAP